MSHEYAGNDAFLRSLTDGLTPDPPMTVAEWADTYRILSGRAAAEEGKYRTSRTPYMREIMESLSPSSPIERRAVEVTNSLSDLIRNGQCCIRPAACGGWSKRATLYGGNQTPGRDAAPLDPAKDAARIRAMYTHPSHVRKGVGRLIMSLCEEAARAAGFARMELMATMSGKPLYVICGYSSVEAVDDARGGAPVPLLKMQKQL